MSRMILSGNHTEDYENYIAAHVDEVQRICTEKRIPFFFCACISNEKNESGVFVPKYVRAGRTPAAFQSVVPNNDEVSKHFLISRSSKSMTSASRNDFDVDSFDLSGFGDEDLTEEW